MRLLLAVIALVLAPFLAAGAQDGGGERVALVIGNTDYRAIEPLRTASIDARTVAAALQRHGFAVRTGIDLDSDAMVGALREFADSAAAADVAAVFYFGHGAQADGRNYLLPVSVAPGGAPDWTAGAVPLDSVIAIVARAHKLGLVLLDASRQNALSGPGRGPAGLAPPGPLPAHVIVISSAQPNTVADDLFRFHSAFAAALLAHLDDPGVTLGDFFVRVRQGVINDTNGRQEAIAYGPVATADFSFAPLPPQPAPPEGSAAAGAAPAEGPAAADAETALWESIKDSADPAAFDAYLARFPNGRFAAQAAERRAQLAATAQPPAPGPAPAEAGAAAPGAAPAAGPAAPEGAGSAGVAALPGGAPAAQQAPASPAEQSLSEEQRRAVQRSLQQLGYYTYRIDGVFGPLTRSAIARFQELIGAEPTGHLTESQIAALHRIATARRQ